MEKASRGQSQHYLLSLVSSALFESDAVITVPTDKWADVYQLAKEHGVVPLAFVGAIPFHTQIPAELFQTWRNAVLGTVIQNERLMVAQDEVIDCFSKASIPCVVLKGSSLSVFYRSFEHRQLGDIDLLIDPSDLEKAASLLVDMGFSSSESDHHFHTEFHRQGVLLELHCDVTEFPNSKGGRIAKEIMSSCLSDAKEATIERYTFPVPSDMHQALNSLLHMERHMTSTSIGLRQLCDWAAFVASVCSEDFEKNIIPVLESCGMAQFARILTRTCVSYLSLDEKTCPWCMDVSDELAEGMINEIFRGGNMNRSHTSENDGIFMVNKFGSSGMISDMFKYFIGRVKIQFPATDKHPILLPFGVVAFPFAYLIQRVKGKKKQKSITKTLTATKTRSDLYRELKLFKTNK